MNEGQAFDEWLFNGPGKDVVVRNNDLTGTRAAFKAGWQACIHNSEDRPYVDRELQRLQAEASSNED